jgi:hypothetical protein
MIPTGTAGHQELGFQGLTGKPPARGVLWEGQGMIRVVAFVPLASLLLSPVLGDEPKQPERPAAELLSAGVDQAKDQGKHVFLLFGSPG